MGTAANMEFKNWLVYMRKGLGKTQQEFAQLFGVSQSMLSMYERGTCAPKNERELRMLVIEKYTDEIDRYRLDAYGYGIDTWGYADAYKKTSETYLFRRERRKSPVWKSINHESPLAELSPDLIF